ncbi:deoxynucleoside kinase [Alkalibacterium sp. 20]
MQLKFLNSRFKNIKEASHNKNNISDRSIYEDRYFAKVNAELERISTS